MRILTIIDMQNDFAHPDGALFVKGADKLVGPINQLMATYDYIVLTRDDHPPDHFSFTEWPIHGVHNTWGGKFVENLHVENADYIIKKGQRSGNYSAFDYTNLCDFLDIILPFTDEAQLDFVGVAFDYCVVRTAVDAARYYRGDIIRVLKDYTCSVCPDEDQNVATELENEGVLVVRGA